MENLLIFAVLAVVIAVGVLSTMKHFTKKSGCCGSGTFRENKKLAHTAGKKIVLIEGMIWAGAQPDDAAYDADYMLVLGARCYGNTPSASLRSRLDVALGFMEESDAVVILCGGQGSDEIAPESHIMYGYMVGQGADPGRLLIEDTSRNTIQNIENAKAMLPDGARTAVISNGFHLARAKRLMARAGLDPVGIPAPTPYWSMRAVCCLREYCSTLGLILTGRYF